jgi:outer membrane scaffolding protein for murein synthesis (MipA/OmpV family)
MVLGISAAAMVAAGHLLAAGRTADIQRPSQVAISFEALSVSSYIWRGLEVHRSSVMQYDTTVARGAFTFGTWANVPQFGENNPDEVDLSLSYAATLGATELSTSIIAYTFPADSSSTTAELCVDFSHLIGEANFYLNNAVDVGLYSGAYYGEAGIAFERELSESLTLDARIGMAWATSRFNDSYFGVRHSGINGAFGDLGFTFSKANGTYVRPNISVWSITDPTLRSAVTRSTMFTIGIGVGIAF